MAAAVRLFVRPSHIPLAVLGDGVPHLWAVGGVGSCCARRVCYIFAHTLVVHVLVCVCVV